MAVAYKTHKPSTTTFPDGSDITLRIRPMLKLGEIKERVYMCAAGYRHLTGDAEREAFDGLYFDSILEICEGWDAITDAGAALPFTPEKLKLIHRTRRILMCMDLFHYLGIVKEQQAA